MNQIGRKKQYASFDFTNLISNFFKEKSCECPKGASALVLLTNTLKKQIYQEISCTTSTCCAPFSVSFFIFKEYWALQSKRSRPLGARMIFSQEKNASKINEFNLLTPFGRSRLHSLHWFAHR